MPKPISTSRRAWIAAWAALCVAGLAATSALDDSSTPEQQTEKPAHADCDARIADLDKWMAAREQKEKESGVITLSSVQVDPEDECHDAIVDHLDDQR
ncbi:hypothetical protein ACFYWS_03135 [Streptomyces sp. NPDC002795]|uniref:hypothetical protein n=1 Tax=Streptomyces sp. NPDC002795 TaxID=3364665 RepID=UPI0036CDDE03